MIELELIRRSFLEQLETLEAKIEAREVSVFEAFSLAWRGYRCGRAWRRAFMSGAVFIPCCCGLHPSRIRLNHE